MAAEGEGTEVSVGNAYCVVYRLEKSEWVVTGEGWAQVPHSPHYTHPIGLRDHSADD